MSELPYHQVYKKINLDPSPTTYIRRNSQTSPYYYNQSDPEIRPSSYHTYQPQLQEKKIFGFQIFINNQILRELQPVQEWFNSLMRQQNVESIKFNPDLGIPDLNGRNIQIFDNEMQKKYQCAKSLLHDVFQIFKRIKKQLFSIIIFVPEGMVSLLIGTKGHQINKIMRQSYTKIVVNQPINRMTYRTAKIQGQYSDIAKACKMIYDILQQKSSIAYAIEKQPSQFDYTKSKIKTKFIFPYQVIKFLMKKKKHLIEKIQQQTKCTVDVDTDKRNYHMKDDDQVLVINGRLEDVQAYIVMLINMIHPLMSEDRKNVDYTLKLLIPANYVTKLIGQKGYMIKDIIERSGGAQIKIFSDREAQKDCKQCIISINGTIQNKIDASCFILEQIECFKNGGPILQSGKSINQNLVQQFKNSIPIYENEKQITEMDVENTNQNTQNSASLQHNILTTVPTSVSSPPLKHFPLVNKLHSQNKDESEEEGLIECESEEEKRNISNNPNPEGESEKKRKTYNHQSDKSSSRSKQSHSRSRQKRKQKRGQQKPKKRRRSSSKSKSQSVEFRHDREFVQIKMIIPRRLGEDYRQLQYIENIGKSKIILSEQRISQQQQNEMVIMIRGCMKNNGKTIRMLQKRIARYRN